MCALNLDWIKLNNFIVWRKLCVSYSFTETKNIWQQMFTSMNWKWYGNTIWEVCQPPRLADASKGPVTCRGLSAADTVAHELYSNIPLPSGASGHKFYRYKHDLRLLYVPPQTHLTFYNIWNGKSFQGKRLFRCTSATRCEQNGLSCCVFRSYHNDLDYT